MVIKYKLRRFKTIQRTFTVRPFIVKLFEVRRFEVIHNVKVSLLIKPRAFKDNLVFLKLVQSPKKSFEVGHFVQLIKLKPFKDQPVYLAVEMKLFEVIPKYPPKKRVKENILLM